MLRLAETPQNPISVRVPFVGELTLSLAVVRIRQITYSNPGPSCGVCADRAHIDLGSGAPSYRVSAQLYRLDVGSRA